LTAGAVVGLSYALDLATGTGAALFVMACIRSEAA